MPELTDPRATERRIADRVDEVRKANLEAIADVAIREGNKALLQSTPPDGASMNEWHMAPIAESAQKRWDGDGWIVEWTHPHANKIEVGVRPHEIHGDPLLVFEVDGETVFATKVNHPGIPAVGFIRRGFQRAIAAFDEVDVEGID